MSSIRSTRVLRCVVAVAAVAVFGMTSAAPIGVSAAPIDPFPSLTGTVQIGSDLLSGIAQLTPISPYNPAQQLAVGVMLQRPDPAGENAYLAAVYKPKSPNFPPFLAQ